MPRSALPSNNHAAPDWDGGPMTEAVRRVLAGRVAPAAVPDLLFLDSWERNPTHIAGHTLRARQIRRANPALAAEIRAELLAASRQQRGGSDQG